jgi:hypothetical protein
MTKQKGANMNRVFAPMALAAILASSSLWAAETNPPAKSVPLQAGKPAGVKAAQALDSTSWWVLGLGAAGVAGVIALTSDDNGGSMPPAFSSTATATST